MRKILLAFLIMWAQVAYASEKPVELTSLIKADAPYSLASLKRLIFHGYDAFIWTDAENWSYDAPFALTVIYKMSFSTKELVDKTWEEIEGQGALAPDDKTRYDALLKQAFHDVQENDRITAYFHPKKGVIFFYNGKKSSAIVSPAFAKKFLDIWLSEKTSEPKLRRKLLRL